MLKDFRKFILRGNVVDLAVGVVIGAAFVAIVNALVKAFINPLISFASTGSLEKKAFCIGSAPAGKPCPHLFAYGEVVSAVISFVLIAAVVFFLVVKPVNHLIEKFRGEEPTDNTMRECPECLSKVPLRARRCAYCTAEIGAMTGEA